MRKKSWKIKFSFLSCLCTKGVILTPTSSHGLYLAGFGLELALESLPPTPPLQLGPFLHGVILVL